MINWERIQEAVQIVQRGTVARVDIDKDAKVYRVKNVIRIDIKNEEVQS